MLLNYLQIFKLFYIYDEQLLETHCFVRLIKMNNLFGFLKHTNKISHSLGKEDILSRKEVPILIVIYHSFKVFQFHVTSLYISSLAPAPNWPFFWNTIRFTRHSLKRL